MAQLRAEAEGGRRWYHKLFFPLAVKLPLEAAAAVVLAAAVFLVYQQPSEQAASSRQEFVAKKTPLPAAQDLQKKNENASPGPQPEAQTPGYRALDLKPEYGKSAAPSPEVQRPAPAMDRQGESAPPAPITVLKSKSALSPLAKSLPVHFVVKIKNPALAEKDLEKIVALLAGKIEDVAAQGQGKIITASISAHRIKELSERLKSLGEVEQEAALSTNQEGSVVVRIELLVH